MYVHLGNDVSVNEKGIIGIFDIENTSLGNDTREFLKRSEKEGNVVNVSYEMPKSFIVCSDKKTGETVYISQIAASSLHRRALKSI
ncbi:extracellular matrix/biofilm biosynthesis regulator RemA family protein [Ruminococcus sp. HUN007]|uniref:extracellular matrix regulator RemB n=1 Tax=Ruminococcus sp. HUN007 TaxID=1514668 RepID=UPI0005D26D21|nr:extracellular matrix/biofilm biosynthesis regulator RemA family protein [Ruminococcus sp. HUN007]